MASPTVMVSSTFYDLKQIRSDLRQFIEERLGYKALLSEHHSFPIDPDVDTIENCKRRVEQDADILVLIIGGRYGYVDAQTAKSVTNIEYLTARIKGVPVYAYVDKQVLAALPLWQDNPEGNFSRVVDNTAVFGFVDQVMNTDRIWTIGFERAQEITDSLLTQFGYIQLEGLKRRLKVQQSKVSKLYNSLSSEALKLVSEQPPAWEYLLFAQLLIDETGRYSDLRHDHELGLVYGSGKRIPGEDFSEWLSDAMKQARRLIEGLSLLINEHLQTALAPRGVPSDLDALVIVARKVALYYKEALEWSLRCRSVLTHNCFEATLKELSAVFDIPLKNIEEYGPNLIKTMNKLVRRAQNGEAINHSFTLDFGDFDLDKVLRAFEESLSCFYQNRSSRV